MELQEDAIVDIPENRVKYFGGTGKMLLPCPATVEAWVKQIPKHKLMTTDLLLKALTAQFNVQGTCPVTLKKALRTIAHDTDKNIAYWRIVRPKGELIANFPGGVEGHAERLKGEGFVIDSNGKAPKVTKLKESLVPAMNPCVE